MRLIFGERLSFTGEWQISPQRAAIAPIANSSLSLRHWSGKQRNWIAKPPSPLPAEKFAPEGAARRIFQRRFRSIQDTFAVPLANLREDDRRCYMITMVLIFGSAVAATTWLFAAWRIG